MVRTAKRGPRSDLLFRWVPGAHLGGPSLTPQVGGDPSFSRASVAGGGRDTNGRLTSPVARDAPLWTVVDDPTEMVRDPATGLLVPRKRVAWKGQAARTNELHNSDSPATQTRSLTAGDYTLWMDGTGSVNADGATDGDYGTATEGQANDLTFTVSAQQDVTFTVSGTVDRFQCEEGSFRSSFIATAGSSVSRAADDLSVPINFGPQEMTVYGKIVDRGIRDTGSSAAIVHLGESGSSTGPHFDIYGAGGNFLVLHDNGGGTVGSGSLSGGSFGDVAEVRGVLHDDGAVSLGVSLNGGSESTTGPNGSGDFGDEWNTSTLHLNNFIVDGFADYLAVLIAPGVRTMDECRSLVG